MAKTNSATVSDFIDALGTIYDACGYIKDNGGCDACPIKHNCIDETDVTEFANFVTKGSLKEFLDFSDDVERWAGEQEAVRYHEWLEAEREREIWQD